MQDLHLSALGSLVLSDLVCAGKEDNLLPERPRLLLKGKRTAIHAEGKKCLSWGREGTQPAHAVLREGLEVPACLWGAGSQI